MSFSLGGPGLSARIGDSSALQEIRHLQTDWGFSAEMSQWSLEDQDPVVHSHVLADELHGRVRSSFDSCQDHLRFRFHRAHRGIGGISGKHSTLGVSLSQENRTARMVLDVNLQELPDRLGDCVRRTGLEVSLVDLLHQTAGHRNIHLCDTEGSDAQRHPQRDCNALRHDQGHIERSEPSYPRAGIEGGTGDYVPVSRRLQIEWHRQPDVSIER